MRRWRICARPTSRRSVQITAGLRPLGRHRHPLRGHTIRSGGHGFCGISRKHLLAILQSARPSSASSCTSRREIGDVERLRESCDLLVGADGINSRVRQTYADAFQPGLRTGRCRFVWLGTTLPLDAFTFIFEKTEHGWFTVHAYRFDDDLQHLHRRVPRGDVARARPRYGRHRSRRSRSASSSSRRICTDIA